MLTAAAGSLPERALREANERLRRQFEAVDRASQIEAVTSGDVEAAARAIVELASAATGCERVNAWLFNDDQTELHCIAAFEATPRRHSSGAVLREPDFRAEFQALKHARYVDADDPLTDPRTMGYAESYLKPLRISSMLDAVVRVSGRPLGLLCFEHVETPHHWEQDEISFACQLADKLGLALMTRTRLRSEAQLQFANTLLTAVMDTSLDAVLVVGADGRVVSANRRFADLMLLDTGHLVGTPADSMLQASAARMKEPDAFVARIRDLEASRGADGHDELETAEGRIADCRTTVLQGAGGQCLGRAWFFRDITERKQAEARMLHHARHDALTGLANRTAFVEAIRAAIARAARGGRSFAVLYLDLDHFKDVNDSLGHSAGDTLLRLVAERLRAQVRATDTVARLGGDEFAVIVSDIGDPMDAATVAAGLVTAIADPLWIEGNEVRTGSSVGISVYGPGDSDPETLLSHADMALYRAKADARGTCRFFTDEMDTDVRGRIRLRTELRRAVESGQLFLVYQPQVHVASGRITGIEALVRWRHPVHGVLEPAAFIGLAEESGLITALSQWVLREACRQAQEWRDTGIDLDRMSVNLSAAQFRLMPELERHVTRILQETGLPPERLELELTETVLMVASREHRDLLTRLRARGIRVALDDFGTGYSSLNYLRRFPVDRIKIAQEFVSQILGVGSSAAIVKATLGLARELGIAVIAEGVENDEQLELLTRWGCPEAQGYLFAPPLEAPLAARLLHRGSGRFAA